MLAIAVAAEVGVEKEVPKRAKARFFERVQVGISPTPLRIGASGGRQDGRVSRAGAVRQHEATEFVDITVTIDDSSRTQLRFEECGVQVDSR